MIGGLNTRLVLIPPQVAPLGAGRVYQLVVAVDTDPRVEAVVPLSLTFDHRVVSGGEEVRFMSTLVGELSRENPS